MLSVEKVSAGYGKLQILNEVTIEVKPKQITVIVGPNGSGKSTLLKTIAGLTNIYSGQIRFKNEKISQLPPYEITRKGIAYLPQTESTFTHLTVQENFKMAAYTVAQDLFNQRLKNALAIFPKLQSYLHTRVANLSGGERQMVAMTMALLREPSLIMFDEPTANLAPIIARQVIDTITRLCIESGITILLVEQNATRALNVGQDAYLFVNGSPIFKGTARELLEHQELGRLYFGLQPQG